MMFLLKYLTLVLVISVCVHCDGFNNKLDYDTTTTEYESVAHLMSKKVHLSTEKEVNKAVVDIYYESLCSCCRAFFVMYLQPVVKSMHEYLNLTLYPYGNAETEVHNGKYVFTCEHGEDECYGNKIHACAIDIINNVTKSALYACCIISKKSTDEDATECGKSMKIDADPIVKCAKSDKGSELLKHYGDLSRNIKGVPQIFVNHKHSNFRDFKRDICSALTNPPPACSTPDKIKNKKAEDDY